MNARKRFLICVALAAMAAAGCDSSWREPGPAPQADLRPASQPTTAAVALDASVIEPMSRELMAIDLAGVARLAQAQNLDILAARQRVESAHGQYASDVGHAFPVVVLRGDVLDHRGSDRAVEGNIVGANYISVQPTAAIQWMVNPGQVAYDILASKKRLAAARQDEVSVRMRTLQRAANQYFELCLGQATVAAALEAKDQAQELARITALRLKRGTAVPADDLRSQANLSAREQDLLLAVNQFYQASIALAATLQLEPSVTLVPRPERLASLTLVRDDLAVEELMALAVEHRPDLKKVYELASAAEADKLSAAWGGLGPWLSASYETGGIGSQAKGNSPAKPADGDNPATFKMRSQTRADGNIGWRISPAIIGQLEAAEANQRLAGLDVALQLRELRTQVMQARQDSQTYGQLIPKAAERLDAARAALRQVQSRLRVGQAILLDTLDSQRQLAQANVQYAQAIARYNQSQVNLLAALGVLSDQALEAKPAK
jgi:outer membrane protein TolC